MKLRTTTNLTACSSHERHKIPKVISLQIMYITHGSMGRGRPKKQSSKYWLDILKEDGDLRRNMCPRPPTVEGVHTEAVPKQ